MSDYAAGLPPTWAALVPHIDAIDRIAKEHEPDWSVVDPDVDVHRWCGDTCGRVHTLLAANGIWVVLAQGELRGFTHVWLVLGDGSILDPTISQFDRTDTEYTVDTDTEVHWLRSDRGARIAVIATTEPLRWEYRPLQRRT